MSSNSLLCEDRTVFDLPSLEKEKYQNDLSSFFNDDLLFMHYKNDVKMYAAIKGFMQCVVCGID